MGILGSAQLPAGASIASAVSAASIAKLAPRHSALVRVTHWITTVCFLALLVTGTEIVISHPRFYWGETGSNFTTPLFKLHIPSSRRLVPTGYNYVMPDANGWGRALHFEAAWIAVLTGLLYGIFGLLTGHFRKNLLPKKSDLSWRGFWPAIAQRLRFKRPREEESSTYNLLQRLSYLFVIFVLFPLVIWSGLAMSLGFISAFPWSVNLLGGRQSARTIHFFVSVALVLFLLVHVAMVCLAGFWRRTGAMITGRIPRREERT